MLICKFGVSLLCFRILPGRHGDVSSCGGHLEDRTLGDIFSLSLHLRVKMNVLGTVKRVVGKLPSLGVDEDGEEEEQNPYKRLLLREMKVATSPTATWDERERALVRVGHGSYTGKGLVIN